MKTVLKIPSPSEVFHIDSSYSTTVALFLVVSNVTVYFLKHASAVRTVVSVSTFTVVVPSFVHLSCTASWCDAPLRVMKKIESSTKLTHLVMAVDSRQRRQTNEKQKKTVLMYTKIPCREDHTFFI